MLLLVVGSVPLLAACSSGGGGRASRTATTAGPATTASTTTASTDAASDRAAAGAINLTEADMAGWTSPPADDTPDPVAAQLARCAGAPDPSQVKVVDVSSPTFDLNNSQVSSNVTTVRTVADGRADLAAFQSPQLPGCVQKVVEPALQKSMPSGATISRLDVSRLPAPAGIPDSFAFRAVVAVNVPGTGTVNVTSDMVGALVGRAEMGLTDTATGTTPDAALESRLIGLLVGRARAQSGLS